MPKGTPALLSGANTYRLIAFLAVLLGARERAVALDIVLKDVAPDRIEQQRRTDDGLRALPGTPSFDTLRSRLKAKGLDEGDPVFVRIFKEELALELWMKKGERFILFETYPICNWSGSLGPKTEEGDGQSPEGFYTIGRRQLHRSGRWPRSLNIGFPNAFDKAHKRTGSYILVHGGCSSTGCFAMTNPGIREIFHLSEQALREGQDEISVHIFPFRLTDAAVEDHKSHRWHGFWSNLKRGYDFFEHQRVPPDVFTCRTEYLINTTGPQARQQQSRREQRGRRARDRAEDLLQRQMCQRHLTAAQLDPVTTPVPSRKPPTAQATSESADARPHATKSVMVEDGT